MSTFIPSKNLEAGRIDSARLMPKMRAPGRLLSQFLRERSERFYADPGLVFGRLAAFVLILKELPVTGLIPCTNSRAILAILTSH
jgi:hypothetical protein